MTDSDKKERRTHFRGKARPGRRVELEYRRADSPDDPPSRAFTRNIGVGGAFIVTDAPFDVGTSVTVLIRVPTSDLTIEVAAEVRWKANTSDEVGMGIDDADFLGHDVGRDGASGGGAAEGCVRFAWSGVCGVDAGYRELR